MYINVRKVRTDYVNGVVISNGKVHSEVISVLKKYLKER